MSQLAQKEYFDSLIGKTINTRYKLDEKIGAGAMGAVFKGTNLENNKTVAIKVISPDLVTDEKFIKRFEREADLGRLLKHTNIVGVEEFGQTLDKLFFIAMEFVPGETLKAHLAKTGAISPKRCLELLAPLCNALDFAHQHNVLHRDLKPENILVSKNSQGQELLKLADFGIAKRTDLSKTKDQMLTVEGEIFGTPHYMSPEQVLAQKLKPTSDVYSVGVMLYQMLSGKLPLEHPKAQQLLVIKVSQDIVAISKTHSFVSPLFDPVLQKVLTRSPADRYQSAGELLNAVKEVVDKIHPTSNANVSSTNQPQEETPTLVLYSSTKKSTEIAPTPSKQAVTSKEPPQNNKTASNNEAAKSTSGKVSAPLIKSVNKEENPNKVIFMIFGGVILIFLLVVVFLFLK